MRNFTKSPENRKKSFQNGAIGLGDDVFLSFFLYNLVMSEDSSNVPATKTEMVLPSSLTSLPQLFSSVINLSASGTYHEPSCPFCCSRNRDEAEKIWKSLDFMAKDKEERVKQFFVSVGENISVDAIRNHVKTHLDKGDIELRKVEYLSRISNLSSVGGTTIEQLDIGLAVIWECITAAGTIASEGKSLSNAKAYEIKASVVSKLIKTWADLLGLRSKILGEMHDKGEVITIPVEVFAKVFDEALLKANTKEERNLINQILDGIKLSSQ